MRPVDPRLLRASRPARAHLVVASCLAAVAAVAIVAQAALLAAAVAGAVDGSRSVEGVLVVLAVVVVARALVDGAFDAVGRFGAARVMSDLRGRLAEQFLVRRPDGLDTPRVGELSALAVQGVDAVEPYFARFLPQLALSAFVPVAVLAWLFALAWVPALVLAVTRAVDSALHGPRGGGDAGAHRAALADLVGAERAFLGRRARPAHLARPRA